MATEWNWEALPKSLAVYLWNSGSCNGCDSEFFALSGPRYDLERLGIQRVDSPYHADVLVVSGSVIASEVERLCQIHSQMAEPEALIEGFTRAVIDLEGRRKLLEGRSLS